MNIYTLSKESSNEITSFESYNSSFTGILQNSNPSSIGYINIDPQGNLGRHKAPCDQLFIVISGKGWVTGEDGIRQKIHLGQAAFWKSGEIHESGSVNGMTAITIESEDMKLNLHMVKNENN